MDKQTAQDKDKKLISSKNITFVDQNNKGPDHQDNNNIDDVIEIPSIHMKTDSMINHKHYKNKIRPKAQQNSSLRQSVNILTYPIVDFETQSSSIQKDNAAANNNYLIAN